MEKLLKILKCLLLAGFFFCGNNLFAQKELRVMTFNIRLDLSSDSFNAWPFRKDKVASQIRFHEADLLGVQEALPQQMADLQKALPEYKYTGGGREDGKAKGEYSAIFYRANRLELLATSTFWLSPTPTIPGSKGWDSAITRIVTWAKFKDKRSGKVFYHFNTHFDHIGKVARRESAKMILKAVDSLAGKNTAIVTGDFNCFPSDEPIQVLLDLKNPHHLTDTKSTTSAPHYGPTGTFNGFGAKEESDYPIDYIFFNKDVKTLKHATLSQSWQGRFSSDHFPVFAEIVLD